MNILVMLLIHKLLTMKTRLVEDRSERLLASPKVLKLESEGVVTTPFTKLI